MLIANKGSWQELHAYIGRTGMYNVGLLRFNIRVLNARLRFGTIDYLVSPLHAGTGNAWDKPYGG